MYTDGTQGLSRSWRANRPMAAGGGVVGRHWRWLASGCIAVLVVGVLCGSLAAASSAQGDGGPDFMDGPEYQVLIGINRFRARYGLRPLRPSRALTAAADAHSRDMVRRRYYAHNTLNGGAWNRRIKRYVRAAMVGETLDLLFGPRGRRSDASIVVSDWIRSPAHRRVLLTPRLRRVGVARAARRHGRPVVFTADFAS